MAVAVYLYRRHADPASIRLVAAAVPRSAAVEIRAYFVHFTARSAAAAAAERIRRRRRRGRLGRVTTTTSRRCPVLAARGGAIHAQASSLARPPDKHLRRRRLYRPPR